MSLDECPGCGKRVTDFEQGGYENDSAQRGHFACVKTIELRVRTAPGYYILECYECDDQWHVVVLNEVADWVDGHAERAHAQDYDAVLVHDDEGLVDQARVRS